jgi:hypothetical protein
MGIEITKLSHVHGHLDVLLGHLADEDERQQAAVDAAVAALTAARQLPADSEDGGESD